MHHTVCGQDDQARALHIDQGHHDLVVSDPGQYGEPWPGHLAHTPCGAWPAIIFSLCVPGRHLSLFQRGRGGRVRGRGSWRGHPARSWTTGDRPARGRRRAGFFFSTAPRGVHRDFQGRGRCASRRSTSSAGRAEKSEEAIRDQKNVRFIWDIDEAMAQVARRGQCCLP